MSGTRQPKGGQQHHRPADAGHDPGRQTPFLAGDKKFVVLPIPADLRAAVSLQRGGAKRVENMVRVPWR
jgi:hypothetical protein